MEERPDFVTEEQLEDALVFLDELRKDAVTNMFGAVPYLKEYWEDEYGKDGKLTKEQYKSILVYWMRTFGARHSQ